MSYDGVLALRPSTHGDVVLGAGGVGGVVRWDRPSSRPLRQRRHGLSRHHTAPITSGSGIIVMSAIAWP